MGRSKGRKKRRDESPEISLLGAAFNLPTRRTIERDLRAAQAQARPQRVTVVYDSDDEEDDPSEDESSNSSSDDDPDSGDDKSQVKQVPRPPTPPCASSGRGRKLRARKHSEPLKKDRQCLKSSPITPQKAPEPRSRTSKESSQSRRGRNQASPAKDALKASSKPASATFPLPISAQPAARNGFMSPMASMLSSPNAFQPSNVLQPYQLYPAFPPNAQPATFAQANYRPDPNFAPWSVSGTTNAPAPATGGNFHRIPTLAMTSSDAKPVGASAARLQRLQHEIDWKTSKLQAQPWDPVLKQELDLLRKERNMALNDAMLPKTSRIGQGEKLPGIDLLNKQPDDYRAHNDARYADTLSQSFPDPGSSSAQTEVMRESSPERGLRHHLCSSCGIVRSRRYHERYPVAPNKPYTGSLCEGCRNKMLRRGVFGPRAQHACFGCGVYRSKQFNEKHPAKKGDPLLPNYCNKCQKEMRSAEKIANASMINSVSSTARRFAGP